MAKSITLKITKPVITAAAREQSSKCMIALAIREVGGTYPSVTREVISFNMERVRYSYPTPAKAAQELIRFDNGEDISPFVITLAAHQASERPVRYREKATKKKVVLKKVLPKGSRVGGKHRVKGGPLRGVRRAMGLRVIEVKQ